MQHTCMGSDSLPYVTADCFFILIMMLLEQNGFVLFYDTWHCGLHVTSFDLCIDDTCRYCD
jgi:hypothetical protein